MNAKEFKRLPPWLATLVVVAAVGAVGLFRFDMTVSVDFRIAPVIDVQPVAGRSWDRLVTLELDGHEALLRTTDRMIQLDQGDFACVKEVHRLIRQRKRYALAPSIYCRKKLANQSALAADG